MPAQASQGTQSRLIASPVVDGSTAERAFLVNLDGWASEGKEPPPSAFPRLADGTAAAREAVLQKMSAFPGLTLLDPAQLPRLRRLKLADDPSATTFGEPFLTYASDVDADGNEVAGIRVPDVSVPTATYTGWVSRHQSTGGAGQIVDMMGTTLPFAATASEREERHDPRASLTERYRDRADFEARARAAAEALAQAGYILEEDIEIATQLAADRYNALAPRVAVAAD